MADESMTEELLDWYRERLADNDSLELDRQQELLAEVERLRAREAAAMAIVREVANAPDAYSHEAGNHCTFCHASSDDPPYDGVHHTPDCPVTKARALLAEE